MTAVARLRAAVVGLGHQGREVHVPAILRSPLADLDAVCDSDPATLEEVSSSLQVPGYTTHSELLRHTDLDFVVVATPHYAHEAIVTAAARRSVHVLKEKPFARSVADAVALRHATDEAGVHVMTTLQRRFDPVYDSYFDFVTRIGRPFFVDVRYTLYVEQPQAGWRGRRDLAGGGCLLDMGYHMIDLLIWYFGVPDGVVGTTSCGAIADEVYDAEDTAAFIFKFDRGLQGVCRLSRFYPPKTESFTVVGTDGMVEISRGRIRRMRSDGHVAESFAHDGNNASSGTAQIDYFCRVIRGERPNISAPDYHLGHAAVIEACYLSSATGAVTSPHELLRGARAGV